MLAALQTCISAQREPARICVLLDGALLRNATQRTQRRWQMNAAHSLLPHGTSDTAVRVGPLLFELPTDQVDAETVRGLLETPTGHALGSFLVPTNDSVDPVEVLRRFVDVRLADDTEMVMRFYDGRILPFWLSDLPDIYRDHLGTAVSDWIYWTETLEVRAAQFTGAPHNTAELEFPMRLSSQREADLINASAPYLMMTRLLSEEPDRLLNIPHAQRYPFVQRQLEQAGTHGLESWPDLEAYCGLAAALGEHFDSNPAMKSALLQVKAGVPFSQAIAALTDSDWRRIRETKR